MKLLQVVWNFPDTVMKPFDMYYFYWPAREAVLRGWDVEVLTFQVDEKQPLEEIIDGIRVRRCPAGTRKGKPFSLPFIRALLTTDADIISCHGYGEWRSELAILLGRLRGKTVIFTPHFHVYHYRPLRELYDRTIGSCFLNLSSRVVVFTDYTYKHLRGLGVRANKLRVVPHVARLDVFEQGAEEEAGALLREADVTGSPLILGVGQLIERKGWEFIVRCLPGIIRCFPEAKLLIVGASKPEEPLFQRRLWQIARELGVIDHIQILQDNGPEFILDAYRSATIVTHPSFVESFGMVLLEAMAAGKAVVANNATGIPCIVEDGVTGYVVDVLDVPQYLEKLLILLQNPELQAQMGEAGRKRAETHFSQEHVAAQLFAVFNETVVPPPIMRNNVVPAN